MTDWSTVPVFGRSPAPLGSRVSKGIPAITYAFVVIIQASCHVIGNRTPEPLYAFLHTESTEISVQLRGNSYVAKIPFVFANNTGKPISRAGCGGPGWPEVEKKVNGRWVAAYYPIYLACRRIPDYLWEAGTQYQDTVSFGAFEPGHHIGPELQVDSIDGVYRLHWGFTEGRVAGAKGARTVEAISNEFRMTLSR